MLFLYVLLFLRRLFLRRLAQILLPWQIGLYLIKTIPIPRALTKPWIAGYPFLTRRGGWRCLHTGCNILGGVRSVWRQRRLRGLWRLCKLPVRRDDLLCLPKRQGFLLAASLVDKQEGDAAERNKDQHETDDNEQRGTIVIDGDLHGMGRRDWLRCRR